MKRVYLKEVMDLIVDNINESGENKQDAVVKFLLEKEIALMLWPQIKLYYPNIIINKTYEKWYNERLIRAQRQEREIVNIVGLLKEKNIDFMLVKGLALSQILVNDPFARECSDIDILVNKEDMIKTYKALSNLGYRFIEGYNTRGVPIVSDTPDYLYAEDYHEFPCIKYHGKSEFTIIEIKYATSAISYKYIKDFWENSIEISIGNTLVRTFNILDTLIHIIAHLYVNSQCEDGYITSKYFRDFVDLKIFLDTYLDIDWNYIFQRINKYEMIHQAYFALNSINILWPNTVDIGVVSMFNLDKISYNFKCNANGEIWNWKSNIITRCFNEGLRLKEYNLLYKNQMFDETKKRDIVDSQTCEMLIKRGVIEFFVIAKYDTSIKNVNLLLVYNKEIFNNKKVYFFVSLIDNNRNNEIATYNVSNPDKIKWNNLCGEWNSYNYGGKGIEQISIDIKNILSDDCNEICLLLDSFEKIGMVGFRGTGAKGEILISDSIFKK